MAKIKTTKFCKRMVAQPLKPYVMKTKNDFNSNFCEASFSYTVNYCDNLPKKQKQQQKWAIVHKNHKILYENS